jgi:hypothetical protein
MDAFVSVLESRLEAALAGLAAEGNAVLRYTRTVEMIRELVGELKTHLALHPFPGLAAEIRYFKELAPRLYSRLFYFMKLRQVESLRAYEGRQRFRERLEQELKEIEGFFSKHGDICRYYHEQTSYWDQQLFTRAGRADFPVDDIVIILDGDFTLGSYWVSWILANQKLRGWLEEQVRLLENGEPVAQKGPLLPWKRGVMDLVERTYGEWLAGAYGKLTLKEVMERTQEIYGVDLHNHSHLVSEIGKRKKERAKFMGELGELIEGAMDRRLER